MNSSNHNNLYNLEGSASSSSQSVTVTSLPKAILHKTSDYVGVDDRLSMVRVNKDFYNAIQNFRYLLKLHFPDDYQKLEDQARIENKELTQADYAKAFQDAHQLHYLYLNEREKKLMTFFKEGNGPGIAENFELKDFFDVKDKNGVGLVEWARRNNHQAVLDRWFQSVSEEELPQPNWKFLYAILLEQSDEQIKIEFEKLNAVDAMLPVFSGITALHLAAERGRLNVIKLLAMEDVNLTTDDPASIFTFLGATPLYLAAKQGHLEIVKYLCAQPDIELNGRGFSCVYINEDKSVKITWASPILVAALNEHWHVVDFLRGQANIDIQSETWVKQAKVRYRQAITFGKRGEIPNRSNPIFKFKFDYEIVCSEDGQTLPHIAASKNQFALVQALCREADINYFSKIHEILALAAGANHLLIVKYLYEQIVNFANRSQHNFQLILGRMDDLDNLLDEYEDALGVDEEKEVQQEWSTGNRIVPVLALEAAIKNSHLSVIQYFFEECKIKLSVKERRCLSIDAAHHSNLDVIQYMHEHVEKIDINLILQQSRVFLVNLASSKKWQVLTYFYQMPASNVNLVTRDPILLRMAVSDNQLPVVSFLCEHGIDVNDVSPEGYSALFIAAKEGYWDIVEYLAQHPGINTIDISAVDNHFMDIILYHLALVSGHEDKIKHLFIPASVDINLIASGITLLYAAHKKEWGIFKSLYRYPGINFNVVWKDGKTLLHLLVDENLRDMVGYLCRNGAETNVVDQEGTSVIHIATTADNLDLIRCLHSHGADLQIPDAKGLTPLHVAAKNNLLEVAEYLCEQGVDVNATTSDGQTPLHIAAISDGADVFRYLCSRPDINLVAQLQIGQAVFTSLNLSMTQCFYGQPQVVFNYLTNNDLIKKKNNIEKILWNVVSTWAHARWGLPVNSSNVLGHLVPFFETWLRDSYKQAIFWPIKTPEFKHLLIVNMLIEYQQSRSVAELKSLVDELLVHPSAKSSYGKLEKALQQISETLQQELVASTLYQMECVRVSRS